MDRPRVTPKDFFLWAGAMVALYWSVIAFIFLIFNYIDYVFPDVLAYQANPYDTGIGYQMASIVVLFPIYIVLMWLIRSDIARDATRKDIWVRRWALILTLFVAGASIAADLIALLTKFFNGQELTTSFLLKALLILLVASGAFMHFIADYWGYWERNPLRKRVVCTSVAVLAFVSVFAGFIIVGSPWQARLYRFDDQKVTDLQTIQTQVVNYWRSKEKLPAALSDLNDPIGGYTVPTDPQSGDPYTYETTGSLSFKLCAVFNAPTASGSAVRAVPVSPGTTAKSAENWTHEAGKQCFERTIDPQLYPPYSKTPASGQ